MERFQKLALATLLSVLLLVFAGAIVRATGSGLGCPDWPTCWGSLIPPWNVEQVDFEKVDLEKFRRKAERHGRDPATITRESLRDEFNPIHTWIEYVNRLLTVPLGFLTLATFIGSFWQIKRRPVIWFTATASLVVVLVNAWLGARVVYSGLQPGIITLHMALAMLLICLLVFVAWRGTDRPWRREISGPRGRAVWWLGMAVFVLVLVEGVMGSQVRELTDEFAKNYGASERSEWSEKLEHSAIYLVHRSFSWLIVLGTGVFLWLGAGNLAGGLRWVEKGIGILVGALLLMGVVLSQVGVLQVVQVLHVGAAALLVALLCFWLLAARPARSGTPSSMRIIPPENPARRTFLLDALRALPGGCMETLGLTFVVLIAVRVFEADQWTKASLVAASSCGLLFSLFMVQLVRRTGWSVNGATACLWSVAAVSLGCAAWGGRSLTIFVSSLVVALICITMAIPLMSQIYRKHYPDAIRGRLFASTGVVRKLSALTVAALFGWLLQRDLDNFRWLLVIYAGAAVAVGLCVLAMQPVHLQRSNQVRLFGAFDHVKHDQPFRRLLVSWMILGTGNLLCFSLFVEYISNPRYGYTLDEFTIGFITGSVPEIMFLIFVVGWGVVFDRVNFFAVRLVINALFMAGILFYFVGDGLWALCVGIGLHGVARAGGNIAWSLWVTKFAKGDHVAEYMSVHTFLCGIRGVIAPFVAFPMALWLGPQVVGATGAALIFIASLMIWPAVRENWGGAVGGPIEPDPRPS